MKKILIGFTAVILLAVVGVVVALKLGLLNNTDFEDTILPITNTPAKSSPTKTPETSFEQGQYKTQWVVVRDTDKITLHSNLAEPITSLEAQQRHGCQYVISGGFYSKENTHIGQFLTEFQTITGSSTNALFNGYLSIPEVGRAAITFTPNSAGRIGLQAGPVLLAERKPLTLSLKSDGAARRVIAATTREGNLVFLIIYNSSSLFSGPLLAELPEMLSKVEKSTPLQFNYALNLDGGTASAFVTDTAVLTEATKIGSYFCIKP